MQEQLTLGLGAKLCECGCGQPTPLAKQARPEAGIVKGQPARCISGHRLRDRSGPDYRVEPTTGCWLWCRGKTGSGYGMMTHDGRRTYAHVAYFERSRGAVPPGAELDHLCRNRACVNPDHLEPVSHRENMRRSPLTTKLTDEQVDEIVVLCIAGWLQADIASAYGITAGYVSNLRHGRGTRRPSRGATPEPHAHAAAR